MGPDFWEDFCLLQSIAQGFQPLQKKKKKPLAHLILHCWSWSCVVWEKKYVTMLFQLPSWITSMISNSVSFLWDREQFPLLSYRINTLIGPAALHSPQAICQASCQQSNQSINQYPLLVTSGDPYLGMESYCVPVHYLFKHSLLYWINVERATERWKSAGMTPPFWKRHRYTPLNEPKESACHDWEVYCSSEYGNEFKSYNYASH